MAKYRQYVSTLSIDQIASIETAFQLNKNGAHLCVLRKQREKKKKKKCKVQNEKKKMSARVYKGWETQQAVTFGRYLTHKLGDAGNCTAT
jgi:hypothetical protein